MGLVRHVERCMRHTQAHGAILAITVASAARVLPSATGVGVQSEHVCVGTLFSRRCILARGSILTVQLPFGAYEPAHISGPCAVWGCS